MADRKSGKRAFVEISSSSEESESVMEELSSASCTDDDESDDASSWSCSEEEDEDEASTCSKIIHFLQGRGDLQKLKLVEYKVYLRRHGLRFSGTKEECIERIKEHLMYKDFVGRIVKESYGAAKQQHTFTEKTSLRLNVLAEKHTRGAAAKSIKAMRRTKMEMNSNKSLPTKEINVIIISINFIHLGLGQRRQII